MTTQSELRYRPSQVARNDEPESISLTAVRLLAEADAAIPAEDRQKMLKREKELGL